MATMTESIDPRSVYARTPAGAAELGLPQGGLAPAARRVLILIDGRRPVAQLPGKIRPGELPRLITELRDAGLITLVGVVQELPAGYSDVPDPRLALLKSRLRGAFERELGAAGLVLEARVQDCVNMLVMRSVLREVIGMVEQRAGPVAARRISTIAQSTESGEPGGAPARIRQRT